MSANVQLLENSHGSLLWMFPPSYRSQKDFGWFVGPPVCSSGYLPASVVEQELYRRHKYLPQVILQPLHRSPEESLKKRAYLPQRVTWRLTSGLQKGRLTGSSARLWIVRTQMKRPSVRTSPSPRTTVKMLNASSEQPSLAEKKHYTDHQAHSNFSIRVFFLPMRFRFSPIHPKCGNTLYCPEINFSPQYNNFFPKNVENHYNMPLLSWIMLIQKMNYYLC